MILTVVDYFSKVVHFVALPKLHSAKETANQMVFLVFCLNGIPLDIVSDEVHSLFLMSGNLFAKPWEPLSAYAMVFIHIRMIKQRWLKLAQVCPQFPYQCGYRFVFL